MHFQKQDLEGAHYYWAKDDSHAFIGDPTRRSFDKFNGDQVLFLINLCGSIGGKFTVEEGKKIEKRILFDLPDEARSEISVFNWIRSSVFALE